MSSRQQDRGRNSLNLLLVLLAKLFAFTLLEKGKVPFLLLFLSLILLVAIRKASFCSKELLEEWD